MKVLYRNISPFRLLLILISPLFFLSCLNDPEPKEIEMSLSGNSMLLKYLESKGDFINNISGPMTFDAQIVNSGLNFFKIIDLRSKEKYLNGHIPNSINVSKDSIFTFVKNNVPDSILVVLVSESGQLSGYLSSLFWLLGNYNIYSLDFGIAAWNHDFAAEVIDERNLISESLDIKKTNQDYAKLNFQPLPEITLKNINDLQSSLEERIHIVANQTFLTEKIGAGSDNHYLVCYGNLNLYKAHAMEGPDAGEGHPIGAVHYKDAHVYDLRSSNDLQTLPPDRKIVIYSFNGQLSAYVVAYLRVLGYNAYSLKYGASIFAHERLLWGEYTKLYVFDESKINNFDYEK